MSSKKMWRRLLLGLLLGVVVVFALSVYGDAPKVVASLQQFDWRLVPLILLLTSANYCLRWVKWQYYLRILDIGPVRRLDSVLLFFSGLGMTVTPGKAGEWVKSVLLRQMYGTPFSHSAPIVLAERLSDGLAMLVLASMGVFVFRFGGEVLVAVFILGVIAVGIAQSEKLTLLLLDKLERFPLVGSHTAKIRTFYLSINRLLQWRSLAFAVGLGLISWFGECVAFFFVLWGLGVHPSPLLLLQATFILALATLVGSITMLPGGLGTAEGSIALLLVTTVGIGSDQAVAATLLIRLCTLWFGVTIGLLALAAILKRTGLEAEPDSLAKDEKP